MKQLFLLSLFCFCSLPLIVAQSQSAISGKASDGDTGEGLIGANIVFLKDGVFVYGTTTDFDGNYKMKVEPGTYAVEASYIGLPRLKIEDVVVYANKTTTTDFLFKPDYEGYPIVIDYSSITYLIRLINTEPSTSGSTLNQEEIRRSPNKDISELLSGQAGISLEY